MTRFLIAFFLIFLVSCESEKIEREKLLVYLRKKDPGLTLLVPESFDKPLILCSSYEPPCIAGYKIVVIGFEVFVLEFDDIATAQISSRVVHGMRYKNWVFEDVMGEPVLERFFENKLKMKPYTKEIIPELKKPSLTNTIFN